MNKAYDQVVIFNQTILGLPPRTLGTLSPEELEISVKCLYEEAQELGQSDDMIDAIDAAIDSIYFGMGILYKMGIDGDLFDSLFSAVHEANMTKKKGVRAKRATGAADAIKPVGWQAPEERIKAIIMDRMIANAD